MKRLILVALAVAGLGGGWSWWGDDSPHAATAPTMYYADDGGGGRPDCNGYTLGWHYTDAYGREYVCQNDPYNGDYWVRVGWDGR